MFHQSGDDDPLRLLICGDVIIFLFFITSYSICNTGYRYSGHGNKLWEITWRDKLKRAGRVKPKLLVGWEDWAQAYSLFAASSRAVMLWNTCKQVIDYQCKLSLHTCKGVELFVNMKFKTAIANW